MSSRFPDFDRRLKKFYFSIFWADNRLEIDDRHPRMDEEEDLIMQSAALVVQGMKIVKNRRKQKREYWVHPILQRRKEFGEYHRLVNEFRVQRPMHFYLYHRMHEAVFNGLVNKLEPSLTKTSQREPISVGERLSITLRFLGTGDSFQTIAWSYRVGIVTVHNIVLETCEAIWRILSPEVLTLPNKEGWHEISKNFYEMWNFPNALGAIDGKHIVMQAPVNAGSDYFNYKKTHSIVLMAISDALYRFVIVDIGKNGRLSDRGIFNRSTFLQALEGQSLDLPEPQSIPDTETTIPFVFIGDEAFPLRSDLMIPIPGSQLDTDQKRIYNYRLSRARRVVENAFGILASKWRLFRRPIIVGNAERAESFVRAAVCLHNYLRNIEIESGRSWYANDSFLASDSTEKPLDGVTGMLPLQRQGSHNHTFQAGAVQGDLIDYFSSEVGSAATPWQDDVINSGRDGIE